MDTNGRLSDTNRLASRFWKFQLSLRVRVDRVQTQNDLWEQLPDRIAHPRSGTAFAARERSLLQIAAVWRARHTRTGVLLLLITDRDTSLGRFREVNARRSCVGIARIPSDTVVRMSFAAASGSPHSAPRGRVCDPPSDNRGFP